MRYGGPRTGELPGRPRRSSTSRESPKGIRATAIDLLTRRFHRCCPRIARGDGSPIRPDGRGWPVELPTLTSCPAVAFKRGRPDGTGYQRRPLALRGGMRQLLAATRVKRGDSKLVVAAVVHKAASVAPRTVAGGGIRQHNTENGTPHVRLERPSGSPVRFESGPRQVPDRTRYSYHQHWGYARPLELVAPALSLPRRLSRADGQQPAELGSFAAFDGNVPARQGVTRTRFTDVASPRPRKATRVANSDVLAQPSPSSSGVSKSRS